jgi:uncharacterized protein
MNGGLWKKLIINIDYLILSCFFVTAALNGWVDVIKYLIFVGADINRMYVGSYNESPLHVACINSHIDAVDALLNAGANPSVTDCYGNSPLCEVAFWYEDEVEEASLAIINRLVMHGANIDFRSESGSGNTPLMRMIEYSPKFLRGIELLVAYGCDVNTINELGKTPLSVAIQYNRDIEIIKILLNAGADPNFIDGCGKTPLSFAIQYESDIEIVQILLNAGANPNFIDGCGKTPLSFAIQYESDIEIVQILLNAGANPNFIDGCGKTCLQNAADKDSIVKMLLAAGSTAP